MRTFLVFLVTAITSLWFFSCQKEQSNSQGDRLKMIRVKEKDSVFYRSFQYDDQNRLISILDSNNNGHKRNFIIKYDAQGKLSQVTEGGSIYTFTLDDKGRIVKKSLQLSGQQTTTVENTYNYDVNGRVIADSLYSYWTKDVYNIVFYSYDQSSNVIETKIVDKSSGAILGQGQYTYDNHPNPFSGKNVMTYLLSTGYEIPTAGDNNLLKEIYDDGTMVNYSYEYYSNGLPKKCSFQDSSDPLVTYIDYFYE
jgi:YD repeat-containing protein